MKPYTPTLATSQHRPLRRWLAPICVLAATAAAGTVTGCSKPAAPADAVVAAPASNAASVMDLADVDVTTKVKTALLNEPTLKSFDIAVTTTQGDVRLNGMVDSQAQVDTALKLARAAEGVHTLHDELSVRK